MKKFSNPHIVSLLGKKMKQFFDRVWRKNPFLWTYKLIILQSGVSTQSSEGAPLMILEYMPYGDLHSFLLKHK